MTGRNQVNHPFGDGTTGVHLDNIRDQYLPRNFSLRVYVPSGADPPAHELVRGLEVVAPDAGAIVVEGLAGTDHGGTVLRVHRCVNVLKPAEVTGPND